MDAIPYSFINRMAICTCVAFIIVVFYSLLKKIFAFIYQKDKGQNRTLSQFSEAVSQLLSTEEITEKLIQTLRDETGVDTAYVFLQHKQGYRLVNKSMDSSTKHGIYFMDHNAIEMFFQDGASCFTMDELMNSPAYGLAAPEEKHFLKTCDIAFGVPLRNNDGIAGFVLLPKLQRKQTHINDTGFVITACAIASIAMKNAALYERIYREARIDSLTDVYNYRHFIETIHAAFAQNEGEEIALLYLDIDDMKLYNQLFGTDRGDYVLKEVAHIITETIRGMGTVFRHSGKVFAILLPGYSEEMAFALAIKVQEKVSEFSRVRETGIKTITLSGGICVSPKSAKNPEELMERADVAVFTAKAGGKGKINIFRPAEETTLHLKERVKSIIDITNIQGKRTRAAYMPTVLALTAAIDAKDHYTYTHSQNVAYYASILAMAASMGDDLVKLVYEAALLHDIGKISIPESILCKKEKLTEEEQAIMNSHVISSIEMIRHLPSMDYVIPAAIAHHEHWDGTGYPRRLAGEEIPILGRCLAIADAFDAMTSNRPYRPKCTIEYAIEQLRESGGHQFDPELVHIFISLIKKGELGIMAS